MNTAELCCISMGLGLLLLRNLSYLGANDFCIYHTVTHIELISTLFGFKINLLKTVDRSCLLKGLPLNGMIAIESHDSLIISSVIISKIVET